MLGPSAVHTTSQSHILVGSEFDLSDHHPSCHPEMRLNISGNIQVWMHNLPHEYKIWWLSRLAGVGKSAILQTIAKAKAVSLTSILGATLFFLQPNECNDPQCVFTTIAYQLSMKYPTYQKYIIKLLTFNPMMVKKSMREQFKAFIIQPFVIKELLAGSHNAVLIFLNGLDECKGDNTQHEIILLITKFSLKYPTSPLIWLIMSCPESHIQDTFSLDTVRLSYRGTEVDVDSDEGRCDHWQSIPSSLQQWPSKSDFTTIATQSSGLFIFLSTLIRFIGDEDYADPISQLKIVLDVIESMMLSPGGKNPFATLNVLYTCILSEIPQDVLQTMLSLLEFDISGSGWPFTDNCSWLGVPQGHAYGALQRLHSVIKIPEPEDAFEEHLYAFHASFYDYLSLPSQSGMFYIGTSEIVQHNLHWSTNILLKLHSVGEFLGA
ncbi:hypothetical protein P691DRAFT_818174 [Macrolepiota fuliginosa MF-IS2]|uniref:Nephrocystin 3-like N-terminal domain-containing protein n=1 Tax=Macrolepiota fuliginosa MF-IS2 TaxID=1400762 RepID=A0A9P5WZT9_9AGAR|nr:hypothetical protein P691DRAFT_818174 [Macrolepiota fuliginosa MF-IS2]